MATEEEIMATMKAIHDTKKHSDGRPDEDVKPRLERLRRQLYRMTGGPG